MHNNQSQENRAYITVTLETQGLEPLKRVINLIQQIPEIVSVARR